MVGVLNWLPGSQWPPTEEFRRASRIRAHPY